MKKIITITITAALLLLSSLAVSASEAIEKSVTFEAKSKTATKEFEKQITENGKKYKLSESISYEILSETPAEKTVTKSVELGKSLNKDLTAPEVIKQDGTDFKLKDISFNEATIDDRTVTTSSTVTFGLTTVKPEPEKTKNIEYFDDITKQTVTATLPLESVNMTDSPKWVNDVIIPLEFKYYDANYYIYNNIMIPVNEEKPELESVKAEILKSLSLDEKSYKLDRFEWVGGTYENENGILCRKANAYGQRLVAKYEAKYSGTVILPNTSGYSATANYTAAVKDSSNPTYKIKATAYYEPIKPKSAAPLAVAGSGISAVGVAFILFAINRKNVIVKHHGKNILKTRVKGRIVDISRITKTLPTPENLTVIIKKSYTSKHLNQILKITDSVQTLATVTVDTSENITVRI